MENKPAEFAASPGPETPPSAACAPPTCYWARNRWLILSIILVGLAFVAYGGTLSNAALFHHVSSTVRRPASR